MRKLKRVNLNLLLSQKIALKFENAGYELK
jgi:hypothetical protein